eukprot:12079582-Alexandrium_andersonii.AAC.1
MSASLVGSEMCIRDRDLLRGAAPAAWGPRGVSFSRRRGGEAGWRPRVQDPRRRLGWKAAAPIAG